LLFSDAILLFTDSFSLFSGSYNCDIYRMTWSVQCHNEVVEQIPPYNDFVLVFSSHNIQKMCLLLTNLHG